MLRRLLPLAYASMVLQGLLAVVLPKRAIDLNARLTLQGFENPGDLEPTDWYVRATRVAGLGLLVSGAAGLLADGLSDEEQPSAKAPTAGGTEGREAGGDAGDA